MTTTIKTKPASDNFDRVFRKPCPRCGKVNAADIHTCTPLEIMEAQQRLTDLCQGEGYGMCDKCDPDKCCRL